ncbi:substrate-binding periplasmic protein [Oceanimonas baumannii]|uniref:substrate-binding periplasmic protein n=1 Tax=Oceanimonas baumannii TaxID=129578 RepID=UPI003A935C19
MLLIFLTLLLTTSSAVSAELSAITACGHPEIPPLSWEQDNELTGIAPHLMRKLLAEQGYTINMQVFGNWERCQLAARRGKVDLLVSAYKTHDREQHFLFSDTPMVADPVVLFTHFGNGGRSPWTLTSNTVGLLFGDSFGDEFDRQAGHHPNVERVSTGRQNFHKLALGRIDYMPIGLATGRLQAQKLALTDRVHPLPGLLALERYHIAIPKGSVLEPLLPLLSARLNTLVEDHYIERITPFFEQKYLDAP